MWYIIGALILFLFIFWDRDRLPDEDKDDD